MPTTMPTTTTTTPTPTFNDWMGQVDNELVRYCGMSHESLADQTWWDWWSAGLDPRGAAEEALLDEGFPFGEDD